MRRKLKGISRKDENVGAFYEMFDEDDKSLGFGVHLYIMNEERYAKKLSESCIVDGLDKLHELFVMAGILEFEIVTPIFEGSYVYDKRMDRFVVFDR
ncbi:MAG: hypothetical protein ACRC2K_08340 [Clostridium sp.]